jgi:hypothetical protein
MTPPKPVIYIPTMALIVPVDYRPKSENVEIRRVITMAYRLNMTRKAMMDLPTHYVPRTIERGSDDQA